MVYLLLSELRDSICTGYRAQFACDAIVEQTFYFSSRAYDRLYSGLLAQEFLWSRIDTSFRAKTERLAGPFEILILQPFFFNREPWISVFKAPT
jgi:hypothetical protein